MNDHSQVPILKLNPFVVEKLWGGSRLKALKLLNSPGEAPVGETWEISRLKEGPASYQGTTLDQILSDEQLPYLIKLIETTDNLSIQAHPGDEYAARVEKSLGKTECWFILDTEPGAGVYLGMRAGITKEQFVKALEAGEDMSQYLVFYPVKRGDFYFVPAGTIHAIGKGVMLAEIQQSCGITYRVWDWNRVDADGKSRELHVDKAMDVIRFEDDFNSPDNFRVTKVSDETDKLLVEHPQFKVRYISAPKKEGQVQAVRVASLLVLKGKVVIKADGKEEELNVYEAGIIRENVQYSIEASEEGQYIWVE